MSPDFSRLLIIERAQTALLFHVPCPTELRDVGLPTLLQLKRRPGMLPCDACVSNLQRRLLLFVLVRKDLPSTQMMIISVMCRVDELEKIREDLATLVKAVIIGNERMIDGTKQVDFRTFGDCKASRLYPVVCFRPKTQKSVAGPNLKSPRRAKEEYDVASDESERTNRKEKGKSEELTILKS